MNAQDPRGGISHAATTVAVVGLGGAAVLHAAWAAGSSFPADDRRSLAELVAGTHEFPGTAASVAVSGALTAGVAVVLANTTSLGDRPLVRLANRVLVGVLAARGVGGLVVSGAGLRRVAPQFRKWDLRVYSPLCLLLAASAALSGRRHSAPTGAISCRLWR